MFRLYSRRTVLGPLSANFIVHARAWKSDPKAPSDLQHSEEKTESDKVSTDVAEPEFRPPPSHAAPEFPFPARRGIVSPEYYVSRSNVGHPDPVADIISAGRADPEWRWLKLLCFICVMSTAGTWVYGVFFPEHIKYFKDEPWSPFKN